MLQNVDAKNCILDFFFSLFSKIKVQKPIKAQKTFILT